MDMLHAARDKRDGFHGYRPAFQPLTELTSEEVQIPRVGRRTIPSLHSTRVVVPTATGQLSLQAGDIDWISAADYYAEIHVKKQRYLIRESLASLAHRLGAGQFVRVHRMALVNIDRVREFRCTSHEASAILYDGTVVPVSRRHRGALRAAMRALNLLNAAD